jgi:hypothetical protein
MAFVASVVLLCEAMAARRGLGWHGETCRAVTGRDISSASTCSREISSAAACSRDPAGCGGGHGDPAVVGWPWRSFGRRRWWGGRGVSSGAATMASRDPSGCLASALGGFADGRGEAWAAWEDSSMGERGK